MNERVSGCETVPGVILSGGQLIISVFIIAKLNKVNEKIGVAQRLNVGLNHNLKFTLHQKFAERRQKCERPLY